MSASPLTTLAPLSRIRCRTTADPMKPAPPVTTMTSLFMSSYLEQAKSKALRGLGGGGDSNDIMMRHCGIRTDEADSGHTPYSQSVPPSCGSDPCRYSRD